MQLCSAFRMCCPAAAADQCTYDYKGIGVSVEGVDDGCLLAGASALRGNTLTCLSASREWPAQQQQQQQRGE